MRCFVSKKNIFGFFILNDIADIIFVDFIWVQNKIVKFMF